MAVTEEQVATLRALLAGDFAEYDRLNAELGRSEDRRGYTALVAAAFFKAAYRRFGKGSTRSDVIEFVGDVRSRRDDAGEKLDPKVAERLIQAVIGDEEILDIDGQTRIAGQFLLLAALIADENLDDAGLEEFMGQARKLAEEWTN